MLRKVVKLVALGATVSLIGALAVVPVFAQQTCCQGGTIIEGQFGGDIASMNPIFASDANSAQIAGFLFPAFVGVDPHTAQFAPNYPGALVKTWDVSSDGTTYTFHLRDDLKWTDGTPITSADVLYTWKAAQAAAAGTINNSNLGYIIDPSGKTGVLDVTAPDAQTVIVKFANAECTALGNAAVLTPVPSHILPADMSQLNNDAFNLAPNVTAGVFDFDAFRPGEQTALKANPDYPDAIKGAVLPSEYIFKDVPDATVEVQQFLAGQTNVINGPAVGSRQDIRNSNAQVYSYSGNSWDYMAFNLADPNNPQNAFDDKGNPIDQGHHPLFGDVTVRQAISHAIDVQSIVKAALFGEGTQMSSFLIPSSWANDSSLPPISYDPKLATQMLAQAGWIDDDNDPTTPLVAKGAKYAPDGTKFEFTLYTNAGNSRRTAIGQLIQDQLGQIGIKVDFQTIDFNTLIDIMEAQTFDAFILGWQNGYPDDPDATQLFTPQSDVVGTGSDFTSFNDAQFNTLNEQAKTVPGCKPEDRAPIYHQMEKIMQDDVPYVWLEAQNGMYAAGANVQGFDPLPDQLYWNVDAWTVQATS